MTFQKCVRTKLTDKGHVCVSCLCYTIQYGRRRSIIYSLGKVQHDMKTRLPISRRNFIVSLSCLAVVKGLAFRAKKDEPEGLPVLSGSRKRLNPGFQDRTFLKTLDIEWSPSGNHIAAFHGSDVKVWDFTTGNNVLSYCGHSDEVLTVKWSPDGKRIASAGFDCTIQIWSSLTGKHLVTYSGHSAWVRAVAWSPDGKCIASAGYDKTVQIWSTASGEHIATYYGHADDIWKVSWSPDGAHVASIDLSNTTKVW